MHAKALRGATMEAVGVNPTQPAPASTAWLAEAAVVHVAKVAVAAVVMAVALEVAGEVVVVTAAAAVPSAADQFAND